MTVRVPFQLRRRASGRTEPASALFVPGRDAAALLSICSGMGLDPSGRVHDVAGGFLLRLAAPTSDAVPGAVRLRERAADLFVPVDAELIPALLDDEVAGLVRDGGLIFLPGGPVLRFDRDDPVPLSTLVAAAPGPRREWRPMPEPPPLADRIIEVSREWPEPPPEELYREWEQDVRRPSAPARGNPARSGTEGEDAAVPRGRGRGAGARDLGEALRGLFGRAGSGARSLGEKLQWGMLDHSSLVRKLLREFRQGDPGRALRHALPMTPADPRAPTVWWGNHLPFSRAIYNLFDLLRGPSRGGPVGIWRAQPDLMEELRREYRRAAEAALRNGDSRRAAYIYGKLLGDDRLAAHALQRGGLHHDAAILYMKKLNDRAAAAKAFEAAGMVDRALALYRELGLHESAGDLLRRINDRPGAIAEYLSAADRARQATPPDWLEVGRILSEKAGRWDQAIEAYRNGWDQRPAANATACALLLATIHAPRGEVEPLRRLLDEADEYFGSVVAEREAGTFYNHMAKAVAEVPALSDFAAEVHDRARSALAEQLRRQVEDGRPPAMVVSSLFRQPALWPSAMVRDAQFAADAAAARLRDRAARADRHSPGPGIQVGRGTVTAACQASATGEVFLGFADGRIFALRPRRDEVVLVQEITAGPVNALAADPHGDVLVVLRHVDCGVAILSTFLRRTDGTFRARPDTHWSSRRSAWLTPILSQGPQAFIGLGSERDLMILDATAGLPVAHLSLVGAAEPGGHETRTTAMLLPHGERFRVLTHDGPRWLLLDQDGELSDCTEPAWRPCGGSRSARCTVPLSWTYPDGLVKVVGLDVHGAVHASQISIEEGAVELLSSPVATTEGGYLAAVQAGASRVVAVSASRVDWLGDGSDRFQTLHGLSDPGLARTVACFPSPSADAVLVVSADGVVTRVDVPRRGRRLQESP